MERSCLEEKEHILCRVESFSEQLGEPLPQEVRRDPVLEREAWLILRPLPFIQPLLAVRPSLYLCSCKSHVKSEGCGQAWWCLLGITTPLDTEERPSDAGGQQGLRSERPGLKQSTQQQKLSFRCQQVLENSFLPSLQVRKFKEIYPKGLASEC